MAEVLALITPSAVLSNVVKIVIALLIFSVIILFHEWGHFLLAKKGGITVTEFSLGMGPRIFSFEKGGTRYSIKALPLGGSCAMMGEDTDEQSPGSFYNASWPKRLFTIAAGPVFNFILAMILALIIVGLTGYDPAEVYYVNEDSPAASAGLQEGDLVTKYNGYTITLGKDMLLKDYVDPVTEDSTISLTVLRDGKKVYLTFPAYNYTRYILGFNRSSENTLMVDSLIEGMPLEKAGLKAGDVITSLNGVRFKDGEEYDAYIKEHPLSDESVDITYERDGKEYSAVITPQAYTTTSLGFYYNTGYTKTSGLNIVKYAWEEVNYVIRSTWMAIAGMFQGSVSVKEVSGPVGVVTTIGETYEASKSEGAFAVWINLMYIAMLLSANLGMMNLLPLPALDGGHLVFIVIEAIRKKPVDREIEGRIHLTGFALLMALMVVVLYSDIMKIV